jgi:hypothetical protein
VDSNTPLTSPPFIQAMQAPTLSAAPWCVPARTAAPPPPVECPQIDATDLDV